MFPSVKIQPEEDNPCLFSLLMKAFLIVFFLSCCCRLSGQSVQTIVPSRPVIVGTAFQVQIIITDPDQLSSFDPPVMDSLRLVSGPNQYRGMALVNGKVQLILNVAYTLEAQRQGKIEIGPATATYKNGQTRKSSDAVVFIVPAPKASFRSSSSFMDANLFAPASDKEMDQLLRNNFFLRATLNRNHCYQGEPVVASFKLFSRLQSASEAEKSPSFYGFSVVDMVDINAAHLGIETINGKVFNTSLLRQVQLFPAQSGRLSIDELVVNNEIEFEDPAAPGNKIRVNRELSTPALTVNVKPLPDKKPESFYGAVGRFNIKSRLLKDSLEAGLPATLQVTITGAGNFIQFANPQVSWPAGIDAFEPEQKDTIDKTKVPASGSRIISFGFTSDSAGSYWIPPVQFAFFNPATSNYEVLKTDSLEVHFYPGAKSAVQIKKHIAGNKGQLLLILPVLLIVLALIIYLLRKRKSPPKVQDKPITISMPEATRLKKLDPENMSDKELGIAIQQSLQMFLKQGRSLSWEQSESLAALQRDCQLLIYASVQTEGEKKEILKRAIRWLEDAEA